MATRKILTDRHFTWDDYLARVKARPEKTAWGESSMTLGDSSWYGTKDLPAAVRLAETGWAEGTQQILEGLEHESSGSVPSLFPAREYDVAGEFPDVAAYCAGVPEHMVSLGEQTTGTSPVIRLGINGGASASTDPDRIMRYGIAVLSHAVAFQRAGYSVAIDWLKVAAQSGPSSMQLHLTRLEILAPGSNLDVDRLAFVLAHPSMLRRFWFADVEMESRMRGIRSQYGFSRPIAEAGPAWYDGVALPGVMECPSHAADSTSAMAEWLGQAIETARTSHAEAA